MAEKRKKKTLLVKMVSTEGTGYFYLARRNPKSPNTTEKFSFRKYDPKARKHVIFKEQKISS